ncbi:hypothetical protein GPL15_13065 [Clostridium sp. MCC353]|uniref:MATE family efflux transporter n=1 Tax=Clostridium sp. MCC353 TaxID=2592646 RepID=UPI001C00C768|nr:MATE family efflux transporter [Clostridium sp. MCC353]MBT9777434.1 hypothetical protein [Clostridium sp. MCC353]
MRKGNFWRCVLPSMLAFACSGVYAIVDGFFIGRNLGDPGLAAINIAYPVTALLQALGTGIGVGGSVLMVSEGTGSESEIRQDQKRILLLLLFTAAVMTAVGLAVKNPVLHLLGARGEIYELGQVYLGIILSGAVFQLLGTGLIPVLRNMDRAFMAMVFMMSGFFVNMVLDYILIEAVPLGMFGAALATAAGQGVTAVSGLLYLLKKSMLKDGPIRVPGRFIQWDRIKRMLLIGLSPFGLTLSPNLILLVMNKSLTSYADDHEVAVYAVISYVVVVVQLLLQGVGDGSQPLFSLSLGMGDVKSCRKYRSMAYSFAAVIGAAGIAGLYLFRREVPLMFGASREVMETYSRVILVFCAGLVPYSFIRVTASYFYATRQNRQAYILAYGEPLGVAAWLLILPQMMGVPGIWLAVPAAQFTIAAVAVWLRKKEDRAENLQTGALAG